MLRVMDFGPPSPPHSAVQPACRETASQLAAAATGCAAVRGPVHRIGDASRYDRFHDAPATDAGWYHEPQRKRLRFCPAGQGLESGPSRSGGDTSDAEPQPVGFALRNAAQNRLRVIAPALPAFQ